MRSSIACYFSYPKNSPYETEKARIVFEGASEVEADGDRVLGIELLRDNGSSLYFPSYQNMSRADFENGLVGIFKGIYDDGFEYIYELNFELKQGTITTTKSAWNLKISFRNDVSNIPTIKESTSSIFR